MNPYEVAIAVIMSFVFLTPTARVLAEDSEKIAVRGACVSRAAIEAAIKMDDKFTGYVCKQNDDCGLNNELTKTDAQTRFKELFSEKFEKLSAEMQPVGITDWGAIYILPNFKKTYGTNKVSSLVLVKPIAKKAATYTAKWYFGITEMTLDRYLGLKEIKGIPVLYFEKNEVKPSGNEDYMYAVDVHCPSHKIRTYSLRPVFPNSSNSDPELCVDFNWSKQVEIGVEDLGANPHIWKLSSTRTTGELLAEQLCDVGLQMTVPSTSLKAVQKVLAEQSENLITEKTFYSTISSDYKDNNMHFVDLILDERVADKVSFELKQAADAQNIVKRRLYPISRNEIDAKPGSLAEVLISGVTSSFCKAGTQACGLGIKMIALRKYIENIPAEKDLPAGVTYTLSDLGYSDRVAMELNLDATAVDFLYKQKISKSECVSQGANSPLRSNDENVLVKLACIGVDSIYVYPIIFMP